MIEYSALKLVTGPVVEPITLDEFKAQARIDHDDEDTLLAVYIEAARVMAEAETGRIFVPQTWDIWFDQFPECIELPLSPLISVTWLKYTDESGDEQTVDSGDYTVDDNSEPAKIYPVYNGLWPTERSYPQSVTVRFIAGYDSGASPQDASTVPVAVKHAITVAAATLYENRESFLIPERGMSSAIQVLPTSAKNLLAKYRTRYF